MEILGADWSEVAMIVTVCGACIASAACIAAALWNLIPASARSGHARQRKTAPSSDTLLRPAPPVCRRA